jgi:hypothetical protein
VPSTMSGVQMSQFTAAHGTRPRERHSLAARGSTQRGPPRFSVKRASAERKRRRHDRAHAVRIEPPRARAGHEAGDENAEAAVLADGVALGGGTTIARLRGNTCRSRGRFESGSCGSAPPASASSGTCERGSLQARAPPRQVGAGFAVKGERAARVAAEVGSPGAFRVQPHPGARCTRSTRTSAASGWVATNEEMTHRALVVRAESVVAHGPARRGAGRAWASANDRR